MSRLVRLLTAWLLVLGLPARAADRAVEVQAGLDLERYLGTWYEIASYPASFQRGCTATTASYVRDGSGVLRVRNTCRRGGLDGKPSSVSGYLRVPDPADPARLEVSFFRPFWADYWVLAVADDYGWALVGTPNRKYLWVLARTRTLDDATWTSLVGRLAASGWDTGRLVRTLQPAE
jgi:apolipoprotein D and lipocalin family protein